MREESHLDDMRSAIRGDFERLAERRGEQELMRVDDETDRETPVEATAEVVLEPPRAEPAREVVPEPAGAAAADAEIDIEVEVEVNEQRRSWLARLFSPP